MHLSDLSTKDQITNNFEFQMFEMTKAVVSLSFGNLNLVLVCDLVLVTWCFHDCHSYAMTTSHSPHPASLFQPENSFVAAAPADTVSQWPRPITQRR
jgi:hypothetical protein